MLKGFGFKMFQSLFELWSKWIDSPKSRRGLSSTSRANELSLRTWVLHEPGIWMPSKLKEQLHGGDIRKDIA